MITGFFDDGFGLGVPERITISANTGRRIDGYDSFIEHQEAFIKYQEEVNRLMQKMAKDNMNLVGNKAYGDHSVKIKNDNGYVFIGNPISPFDVLALKTKSLKQK